MKLLSCSVLLLLFICKSSNIEEKNSDSINITEIVIDDYSKTMRQYLKKYNVFHINFLKGSNDSLKFYSVLPENDTFIYTLRKDDDFKSKLATNYKLHKGKIFIWRESRFSKISDSVFQFFYDNKMIDSSYIKYQLGQISEDEIEDNKIITNESLKGVIYIFNLKKSNHFIKKIKSKKYIDFNNKNNLSKYGIW